MDTATRRRATSSADKLPAALERLKKGAAIYSGKMCLRWTNDDRPVSASLHTSLLAGGYIKRSDHEAALWGADVWVWTGKGAE